MSLFANRVNFDPHEGKTGRRVNELGWVECEAKMGTGERHYVNHMKM